MNNLCWAQVVFGNGDKVESTDLDSQYIPGSVDFRDGTQGLVDWVCGGKNEVMEPFGVSLFTYHEDI
jgi:hypothetical protein